MGVLSEREEIFTGLIEEIEMKDFIAHRDTQLEFCRGISVFVGHNGSGKSSVIDAITFALFGKHTRKLGKNLVRRGANNAMVRMRFSINSREYSVTRTLTASGSLASSQFELISDGGKQVSRKIAGGERRTLGGESMSDEVAKVLGLDYEKLRIAAVVQQGELGRIVEASPKDFKQLLNSLIGIDRLDSAYSTMAEVIRGFEDKIRDETGYSYKEIPKLDDLMTEAEKTLAQSELEIAELGRQRQELSERMAELDRDIELFGPLQVKVSELQRAEKMLLQQINNTSENLASEIQRLERLVKTAKSSMLALQSKSEVVMRLRMVTSELEEMQCRLVENEGQLGKLRGYSEYSSKLVIVDGKCPVCNSPVQKLNKVFDGVHIQGEVKIKIEEKARLLAERLKLNSEKKELDCKNSDILAAEKFLASNGISASTPEIAVSSIERDLGEKRVLATKFPEKLLRIDDPNKLIIDELTRTLAGTIKTLRAQTKDFDPQKFSNARLERDKISRRLQRISEDTGRFQKAKDDAYLTIQNGQKVKARLMSALEYSGLLEKIKTSVYYRDGHIGKSLRSWAIRMISAKASEYAALFNIGISRIELSEETREVNITCYGRHGEIDTDSMSGGEKVAIALALRLGIAYMMGSSKLDFIILDEPTTHLDEDRRKALVRIISEAFREGSGPLAQLIIITHDSEIFEDSEVDQVFRFTMTAEGSKVTVE